MRAHSKRLLPVRIARYRLSRDVPPACDVSHERTVLHGCLPHENLQSKTVSDTEAGRTVQREREREREREKSRGKGCSTGTPYGSFCAQCACEKTHRVPQPSPCAVPSRGERCHKHKNKGKEGPCRGTVSLLSPWIWLFAANGLDPQCLVADAHGAQMQINPRRPQCV